MNVLRLSGSILGVLLSVGWLCADTIIPGDGSVQFTKGGSHSTTITGFGPTPLTGDQPITNGGGTFGVINGTDETIEKVVFDIPTINFDQPFFVSTNLFTTATIDLEPSEDLVIVTFFGIGFAAHGGSATIPKPCDDDCVTTFDLPNFKGLAIGPPPPPAPQTFFGGLAPGSDNTLILAADPGDPTSGFENGAFPTVQFFPTPEPGTFGLLFSGAMVILGWRKLCRR